MVSQADSEVVRRVAPVAVTPAASDAVRLAVSGTVEPAAFDAVRRAAFEVGAGAVFGDDREAWPGGQRRWVQRVSRGPGVTSLEPGEVSVEAAERAAPVTRTVVTSIVITDALLGLDEESRPQDPTSGVLTADPNLALWINGIGHFADGLTGTALTCNKDRDRTVSVVGLWITRRLAPGAGG
ncbi:hypothetical protein AB0M95_27525 [Sphaerisporangium sp. NPDC051017]|uniref:hypothetical protein n=1 Tax=Sphaerisporangium sp. NPDC051017 TaxID=3154636 RepID=UPI0034173F15